MDRWIRWFGWLPSIEWQTPARPAHPGSKAAKEEKFLSRLVIRPDSSFAFKKRKPDQTFGWEKDWADEELATLLLEIDVLQQRLSAEAKHGLLVVLQAMDAAAGGDRWCDPKAKHLVHAVVTKLRRSSALGRMYEL